MINNLFSIFDPCAILLLPLNWIRIILFLVVIVPRLWILSSPLYIIFKKIISSIIAELSTLLKIKKSNIIIFIGLFLLILINNVIGLIPFTFTATRHLAVTLSLALPLWTAFILFRILNNLTDFLAHLVPTGTPPVLIPFMVVIELIRNIIRPITLSVRLAANIIAGHLLLTLLGNQLVSSSWLIFIPLLTTEYILLILESAVACIQAYVFSVLTTLYASEA